MLLDDIKLLLDADDSMEPVLNLYIRKAVTLITNYLNSKKVIDISTVYPDAVIEYVIICVNKKGNEGLKQYKFENVDVTYDDGLSKSVKDLLPFPYVKMLGVNTHD